MAVAVKEGRDYRILEDNYRSEFVKTYKPKKDMRGRAYYRCVYCGERVYLGEGEMQVDHIIPKTRLKAGILWNPNKAWNLGPSCGPCNASKSNSLDKRVFIGFRNKLLSNFGLVLADDGEGREEDTKTTAYISILIALVSALAMVIIPLVGIVALCVSAVRWLLVNVVYKALRKVSRKVRKYMFKHPVKSAVFLTALLYLVLRAPHILALIVNKVVELLPVAVSIVVSLVELI